MKLLDTSIMIDDLRRGVSEEGAIREKRKINGYSNPCLT